MDIHPIHFRPAAIGYSITRKGVGFEMNHYCPPLCPIVCDPIQVVEDYYIPQIVPVIHPIEVIKKHHCVPIHHHMYPVVVNEEDPCYVSSHNPKKKSVKKSSKARTSSRKR